MIRWLPSQRYGPIGVDIGARSVKLAQMSADRTTVIDAVRREMPLSREAGPPNEQQIADAIKAARQAKSFRGNRAVLCLSNDDLFLQNVRVQKSNEPKALENLVHQEAVGRLPFSVADAEVRFIEASDVRQGDNVMRECIVMACERPAIQRRLQAIERAGMTPVAVDVEPLALARCYARQLRRDDDRQQRTMLVHIGYSRSTVVIAQNETVFFMKFIEIGGNRMDESVAKQLQMPLPEAVALRRHNGDRRADQQDPEIAASVAKAVRPTIDLLASELAKCMRYHSVTFRGNPLKQVSLSGGEANVKLCEAIGERLNAKCELSNALRGTTCNVDLERSGHWDIAMGLAMREVQ